MSHGSDHDDESGRETPTDDDAASNAFEAGGDAPVENERDGPFVNAKPGSEQIRRQRKSSSRRKKQRQKCRPKRTTTEQDDLVVTRPHLYSGSRGGVVTHVSCTINKEQIEIAQNDMVQNNAPTLFSCIECGLRFVDLQSLREHVSDKTIWTNRSLLGCRICVMWARNQWYEGMVTQYDMGSEKHCVLYDDNEEKWYHMSSKTFRILSRENSLDETKGESDGPEKNIYDEPLSDAYLVAQSLVHLAYGNSAQQVGYRTDGHLCVTDNDRELAEHTASSLLYGEVLPRGVNKILDTEHMNAADAKSLYDCGMGTGKLALQAWLQFPNLEKVVGVELAISRFIIGERALLNLVGHRPDDYELVKHVRDQIIIICDKHTPSRTLEFYAHDLFSFDGIDEADIAILQTNFPPEAHTKLCGLLMQLKAGCALLTYLNLATLFKGANWIFAQLQVNRSLEDRFPTSWSVHRGCHFFLWEKCSREAWEGLGGLEIYDEDADSVGDSGCFSSFFRCFGSSPTARVQHE
jgi:hypothetical protein